MQFFQQFDKMYNKTGSYNVYEHLAYELMSI
jgi:hypothetical protein